MVNVLADLAIESEAATAVALRLARAYDEAPDDPNADAFKRLATAVAKYHVCKRAPGHAFEALECLGGNGYVEASGMPRLYREAPLASIWEGSGNVMALDVLRALSRSPEALDAFFAEVGEASGADPRLDEFAATTRAEFTDLEAIEPRARRVVERMALCLQGSLLVRHAPAAVADAFCAARLAGDAGLQLRHAAARRRRRGDRRAAYAAGVIGPPRSSGLRPGDPPRRPRPAPTVPCAMAAFGTPQSVKRPTSSSSSRAVRDSSWAEAAICWVEALVSCAEAETCWTVAEDCSATLATSTMSLVTWAAPSAICSTAAETSLTRSETTSMLAAMRVKASRASATVVAPSSPRSAPVSTMVTVRSVSVRISLTRCGDRLRGGLGLLGQLADLLGHDGEAAALLAGARRLDGGVERQQVGLLGDGRDGVDDAADALALGAQLADGLAGLGRGVADGGHGLGGTRDGLGADARGGAGLVGGARGLVGVVGGSGGGAGDLLGHGARGGRGAHLALGAGGDVAQRAGDLLDGAAGIGRRRGDELRGAGDARGRARHLAHRGAQLGDEAGEGGAEAVALGARRYVDGQVARGDAVGGAGQRAEVVDHRGQGAGGATDLVAALDGQLVVDVALGQRLGGARERTRRRVRWRASARASASAASSASAPMIRVRRVAPALALAKRASAAARSRLARSM